MPPATARNMFIILFDLKVKSRARSFHALTSVLLYKQLSQSKDQYKLYLVNTAQTSNKLDYTGICSLDANVDTGTLIKDALAIEVGKSDCLEALDLAVQELKGQFDTPGIITMQILFITDLSSFEKPNNEQLKEKIIDNLTSLDAFLYVIGPSIDPPRTIFDYSDIEKWMADLNVDEKDSNLKIMKTIVDKAPHCVICNYDVGVNLFNSYKYSKGMQPWQVPLTFGTLLSLPISTLRLTKREPPISLKKTSYGTAESRWAYEDQQDVVIDFHDTVSGVTKHGKFIKIESDGRFKIEGPRSFQALGFTEAKNVPEYLLQSDGSYFVVPDQKVSRDYINFFHTLVNELISANLYLLARRVYNKDFNPKFVVLIPRNDLNIPGFLLCQIPYADDIAHDYNELDIKSAPKLDEDKNVYNFLDAMDVSNEKCQVKVPMAPTMMVNTNALNIINKVKEKQIEEQLLEDKFGVNKVYIPNFEVLKNEWPTKKIEAVKKEENITDDFDDVDDFNFT